jgi:hypothetical protein
MPEDAFQDRMEKYRALVEPNAGSTTGAGAACLADDEQDPASGTVTSPADEHFQQTEPGIVKVVFNPSVR